jgi:hypothetical protein
LIGGIGIGIVDFFLCFRFGFETPISQRTDQPMNNAMADRIELRELVEN